ncbi:MAG: hypothetical protein JNM25_12050 [Planctomycetes bacterium]|nr:hypothetical protein [Planctomycetota bacterium]
MQPPPTPRPLLPLLLLLVTLSALGGTGVAAWRLQARLAALETRSAANDSLLGEVYGEVTRIRLEQRADALGPAGLLAKLRVYAPLVTSARTPEPDFLAAKREIDAILRAFEAIGEDAWKPVVERLAQLDGDKDYDEARYLVRAAMRIDPAAGKGLAKEVLAGTRLPSPKMRWDAARMLIEADRPLAQQMLRHIVSTESSRGVNPDRAGAQGMAVPDLAAMSATGFHNFIGLYVLSEDPALEDTLLMVMGRAEHDLVTVQECVKVLGERRCERAVPAIEKAYREPPNRVENPLFQMHCLTSLQQIQGAAARPFLEQALQNATTDTVAKHCQFLLGQIGATATAARPQREDTK